MESIFRESAAERRSVRRGKSTGVPLCPGLKRSGAGWAGRARFPAGFTHGFIFYGESAGPFGIIAQTAAFFVLPAP